MDLERLVAANSSRGQILTLRDRLSTVARAKDLERLVAVNSSKCQILTLRDRLSTVAGVKYGP
jgi:hypothetical protein